MFYIPRLFLILLLLLLQPAIASSPAYEVHLLVDVSGSMKQTDPKNLRLPAIHLLIHLLEQKSLLGIETFSTHTKPIVSPQLVGPDYMRRFEKIRGEITSNGAHTYIDDALRDANRHWEQQERIILLLTDGKLDLGSAQSDQLATEQLMRETLPQLIKNHVRVYSIGFSTNVDKNLLSYISNRTNGISQIALTAKDLAHVMFRIFTAAIDVEGAPLKSINKSKRSFLVDGAVDELTFIIESTQKSKPLKLRKSDGSQIVIDASQSGVSSIADYLVYKEKKPKPGSWEVIGQQQVVERALFLTPLKLSSNMNSGVYFKGESLFLQSSLQEGDKVLNAPTLLQQTKMILEIHGDKAASKFSFTATPGGVFKKDFELNLPKDSYMVSLSAINPILMREKQYVFQVEENPFVFHLDERRFGHITVVNDEWIQQDTIRISVLNNHSPLALPTKKAGSGWTIDLNPLCQLKSEALLQPRVDVDVLSSSGRPVHFTFSLSAISCPKVQEDMPSLVEPVPKPIYNKPAPLVSKVFAPKPLRHAPLNNNNYEKKIANRSINAIVVLGSIAAWTVASLIFLLGYRLLIKRKMRSN